MIWPNRPRPNQTFGETRNNCNCDQQVPTWSPLRRHIGAVPQSHSNSFVGGCVRDREIYRARDETILGHFVVKGICSNQVRTLADLNLRSQDGRQEPAGAVGRGFTVANGRVLVMLDGDSRAAGEVQIPEHVACRERR